LTNPDFNKMEILSNCIDALKEHFLIENQQLNQPINLSDIHYLIKDIPGVISLITLNIKNIPGIIDGRQYSTVRYNINENTKNGIIYSKDNAIFEILYPNIDIKGTAR